MQIYCIRPTSSKSVDQHPSMDRFDAVDDVVFVDVPQPLDGRRAELVKSDDQLISIADRHFRHGLDNELLYCFHSFPVPASVQSHLCAIL